MSEMEYHEIGEIFKYNDVVLEVVEIADLSSGACNGCYFADFDTPCFGLNKCSADERDDKKDVVFKLVGQCKITAIEQKTENLINGIYDNHTIKINENADEQLYGSFLNQLFETYKAKNTDYKQSFSEIFNELGVDYSYCKLREKMSCINVLRKQPNMVDALEEKLLDTAEYAILTLVELKKRKQ